MVKVEDEEIPLQELGSLRPKRNGSDGKMKAAFTVFFRLTKILLGLINDSDKLNLKMIISGCPKALIDVIVL